MKKFLTIFILLLAVSALPTFSQLRESIFIGTGSSSVSAGSFVRASSITACRIGSYETRLGMQATFARSGRNVFSGLFVDLTGDYHVKSFPVSATLFFRYNPYSPLISETNFGLKASHHREHLELHLGYNSRIYSMAKEETYVGDLDDPDMHIYEWRNFMYKGILWLKPMEHKWNLGASLTNFDYFLIQQETNPMLTALFQTRLSEDWDFYTELWYQGAGMLNLASNYYGYYLRAGFKWQLN